MYVTLHFSSGLSVLTGQPLQGPPVLNSHTNSSPFSISIYEVPCSLLSLAFYHAYRALFHKEKSPKNAIISLNGCEIVLISMHTIVTFYHLLSCSSAIILHCTSILCHNALHADFEHTVFTVMHLIFNERFKTYPIGDNMHVFQHTDCVNPFVPELSPWCNLQKPRCKLHGLIFFMQKESPLTNTAIKEQP